MIARRIGYAVAGLVIVSSGGYLFVYLYRWEWNRALIAGIIFVAAEVALATMMLLEKLRSIENRLDEQQGAETAATDDAASSPRAKFRWLAGDDGELGVFIPVLMGAGMIFSAIAWALEKLAHMTARPALEKGLAIRLQPLALPEGGFLTPVETASPIRSARRSNFKYSFYAFVFAAALFLAIDALGDLTQNRPELDVSPAATAQITVDITREGWVRTETAAAKSLWHACRHTVAPGFRAKGFTAGGGGLVTFTLTPAPGASAERRLQGCLEDATLDNVLARIVGFSAVP